MDTLKNMGYTILTDDMFKEIEEDETNETLEKYMYKDVDEDLLESINYNFIDVKNINVDENGLCDIEFEDKNIDVKYLEWYITKDWVKGMEWYKQIYSYIPFIDQLAYFYVRNDLKGSFKLEKFEKNYLKDIKKKQDKVEKQRLEEEKKLIREIKKAKKHEVLFKKGEYTLKVIE